MSDDFSSPEPDNPYASPISAPQKPQSSKRRDGLILGLGIAGIITTVLGLLTGFICCLFWPLAAVGGGLGGISGLLGYLDLRAIKEGRLDPAARSQTEIGSLLGLITVGLCLLVVTAMIVLVLVLGLGLAHAAAVESHNF